MKLRIRGNSLRLRVTRSDLHTLMTTDRLCASVEFPLNRRFSYALQLSSQATGLHADFLSTATGAEIIIFIPREQAVRWQQPEQVGLSGTQRLEDGSELLLLLEKDFPCLTPRAGEEDADAFARPA